jgi:DNA polymerase elongation subunit (family B)
LNKSILVYDIETDSKNSEKANLKWFGAYSYVTEKYYLLDNTKKEDIKKLIQDHKYSIGFNNESFDRPIVERFLEENVFDYKITLDLYQCLAPKSIHSPQNKGRLVTMGYNLENYKLKTITDALSLGAKGEVDYKIFQKDVWSEEERKEIKKYLQQDIEITKKLFEWYWEQFAPLIKFLDKEDVRKLKHLKCSTSSLGYMAICNKAGLKAEWNNEKPEIRPTIIGAHHIDFREDLTKGNIVSIDFASMYPHNILQGNLFSPCETGWNGGDYFDLQGTYDIKEQGKIEKALKEIMLERLEAKKNGDKTKSLAYKIVINAVYGSTGNYCFKHLYNPVTANDTTAMGRTLLKKLAATLELNGFRVLYGFTDGVYILIPEGLNKEILMMVVQSFIDEVKKNVPFPLDTFKVELEQEIKMIWFYAKNCYLWVTKNDEVIYKSTLLNKNAPKVVLELFENYIKPKIVKELDVNFISDELEREIKKLIERDVSLVAEKINAKELDTYKVQTSIHYQVSEAYGSGDHLLIPNTALVGVGKDKGTKIRKPLRYCSLKEFKENGLTASDVDMSKLLKWIKPFLRLKKVLK